MSATRKPLPDDRRERRRLDQVARIVLPVAVLALGILAWDLVVRVNSIPPYVLPGPGLVFATMWSDRTLLWESLLVTLTTTLEGFGLALAGGVCIPAVEREQLLRHEDVGAGVALLLLRNEVGVLDRGV